MEIKRIDGYDNLRFSARVLRQHGAFLVNGMPCEVEIISRDTAILRCPQEAAMDELIAEFRFYAEHITRFVDENGGELRTFPPVAVFDVPLADIQPSQFYVDEDKLAAVNSFIHGPEDVIIPLLRHEGRYVSLDGHTRMLAAQMRGFACVRGFLTASDPFILRFVEEARKRGIREATDMTLLPHEEYRIRWDQFCDDFFTNQQA